jgi:hypothetical protein
MDGAKPGRRDDAFIDCDIGFRKLAAARLRRHNPPAAQNPPRPLVLGRSAYCRLAHPRRSFVDAELRSRPGCAISFPKAGTHLLSSLLGHLPRMMFPGLQMAHNPYASVVEAGSRWSSRPCAERLQRIATDSGDVRGPLHD